MSRQSQKAPSDRFADITLDLSDALSEIQATIAELQSGVSPSVKRSFPRQETRVERLLNGLQGLFDDQLEDLADEYEKFVRTPSDDEFVAEDGEATTSNYENSEEEEEAEFTEEEDYEDYEDEDE